MRDYQVHPDNAAEEARWDALFAEMTKAQWDGYCAYRSSMSREDAVVAVNCRHLLKRHGAGQ